MAKVVSVIIPNYNHAAFLEQRIESILSQTFADFEVIILDDLSPDNSREVIEQYRDHPQVSHIIYNTVNSGNTFLQWDKGVQLARGEFIWIAESDDWCEPTLLENLMKGLLADENVGLAFCQSCMVLESNSIKEISFFPYYEKTQRGSEFIQEYMLYSNRIINASMAVWRKSLFSGIDEEYKSFRFSGDWLFWISLLQQSDVFISGKVLNYFRKHSLDVSSGIYKSGNNYLEDLRLFEILWKRGVVDRNTMIDVIKARYIVFLQDGLMKDAHPDALTKIREQYGRFLPVNRFTDQYYRLKGFSRFLKSSLGRKT